MYVTEVPCGFRSYGGQGHMASPVLTLISWLRVSRSTNDVNMSPATRCMQSGILSSPGRQELSVLTFQGEQFNLDLLEGNFPGSFS